MSDEEIAINWIRSQGWSEENLPSDEFFEKMQAFLAGLKACRQGQSGIGWIDTAHIEVKLHDAVENIKKQLDSIAQEILGGNYV